MNSLFSGDWYRNGSFEKECSDAVSKKLGKQPRGFFLPHDVQVESFRNDLTSSPTTAGGYLIGTQLRPEEFVDVLRNSMMLSRLGARTLSGLVGDIAIPKKTAGTSVYWVSGDQATPTEGTLAFGQLGLSPKTVGTYIDISRKLLNNSTPSVEALVRADLASAIACGIDAAGINGSATGSEPRGILKTVGIGDVAMGADGAAITYAAVLQLWGTIAVANANAAGLAFLTNAKTVTDMAKTLTVPSYGISFIVNNLPGADGITQVAGLQCAMSNNVPCNLTKGSGAGVGVCSAMICGNFSDLIIALWTGLDINLDTSAFSREGGVRIVALQDADIGLRRAASFAAIQDIRTTL